MSKIIECYNISKSYIQINWDEQKIEYTKPVIVKEDGIVNIEDLPEFISQEESVPLIQYCTNTGTPPEENLLYNFLIAKFLLIIHIMKKYDFKPNFPLTIAKVNFR